MDTQTHLTLTIDQAHELSRSLEKAIDDIKAGDRAIVHISKDLEQASERGPWRLILTVTSH